MAKDWMFRGVTGDIMNDDYYLELSCKQGQQLIDLSEKLKKQKQLSELELQLACAVLECYGKDRIKNAKKYIPKKENGSPAYPFRYEAVLQYYIYLRVIKIKQRARLIVCDDYEEVTDDLLIKWIKQEEQAGNPIKKQADNMVITNPEVVLPRYLKIKGKN